MPSPPSMRTDAPMLNVLRYARTKIIAQLSHFQFIQFTQLLLGRCYCSKLLDYWMNVRLDSV